MNINSNGPLWTFCTFDADPATARAELGGRVRRVRQRRLNLTLAEFGRQVAELSGRNRSFSNVTVANWESGRQEPSFATLQAICRLAKLPLSYFAGVGDVDDWPRIDWFRPLEHGNDPRLRRIFGQIQGLPDRERRTAMAAIEGLIEGLARAREAEAAAS